MKVLILEDDPVSLQKLKMDVESFGHGTLEAADSVVALNLFYENRDTDVIITDLELPFGSGEDFIQNIRSLDRRIPIIVVSGTISRAVLQKIKNFKCKDIMVKPHDKARLKEILDSI